MSIQPHFPLSQYGAYPRLNESASSYSNPISDNTSPDFETNPHLPSFFTAAGSSDANNFASSNPSEMHSPLRLDLF
ncbi:MAG: hypothetical protein J6I55_06455 [Ruminococcus sp.]|nr:hypothetical protein [Ruminococcus sp.]